jgi:hypothetical protein
MEDILVLLVQFLIEFLGEMLTYLPWDMFLYSRETNGSAGSGSKAILSLFLGGCIGGLSLLVFPNTLMRRSALRIGVLILAPLASGWLARATARRRRARGAETSPLTHFWCSALFTFGLVAIRFAYCHRPAT